MQQVWIMQYGEPEVLQVQRAPDPDPGPGAVRIAVEAAGVNFADLMGRMGIYPDAPPAPYVPGYEVAGRVAAVGRDVTGLAVGDPVLALARLTATASKCAFRRPTCSSVRSHCRSSRRRDCCWPDSRRMPRWSSRRACGRVTAF